MKLLIVVTLLLLYSCNPYRKSQVYKLSGKADLGYSIEQKALTKYWYRYYQDSLCLDKPNEHIYLLTIERLKEHFLSIRGTNQDSILRNFNSYFKKKS